MIGIIVSGPRAEGVRRPPHISLTKAVLPRPRVEVEYLAHRTRLSRGEGGELDRSWGAPSTRGVWTEHSLRGVLQRDVQPDIPVLISRNSTVE